MKKLLFLLSSLFFLILSCSKRDKTQIKHNNKNINFIESFCKIDIPNTYADFVLHYEDLKIIYDSVNYQNLWFESDNLSPKAKLAITKMEESTKKGLDVSFYQLSQLYSLLNLYEKSGSFIKKISKAALDIKITDSYLHYSIHLAIGWSENTQETINKEPFRNMIINKNTDSTDFLFEQKNIHYKNYLKAWNSFVDKYEKITETDIPFLTVDSIISYQMTTQRLLSLRILEEKDTNNTHAIRNAIIKFQYQFGIESSGKPDSLTIVMLNKGFAYYHEQAMLTIEKLKKLELDSLSSYILINIPTYTLFWVEQNELATTHRIVTGTVKNQTPELSSSITKFTLFPDWNLPYSIATKETLPNIKRCINYLDKNKYIITNSKRQVIDPHTINWSKLNRTNFPYRIVQTPGEHNALGLVKYFFNNSHDVYLHDTPQKRFFQRNIRSFSHGCMRLENPFEFLKTILEYQEGMLHYSEELLSQKNLTNTQKKFEKVRKGEENIALMDTVNAHLDRRQQSDFRLKKSIPLRIVYLSSFYDFNGLILFYPDIYSREVSMLTELKSLKKKHLTRREFDE